MELKSISKKFAFIHLFFNQYSKIMKRVHLIGGKQEDASNDYHKNIRNLSWFLFIMQRQNKPSEELPTNANYLLSALCMVLRYSGENYKLEFVISESGNKTIIPGDCKDKVENDILEYLSKIMNFTCDEETLMAKKNFYEDIYNLFFEHFCWDKEEIRKSISDKVKISTLIRKLEAYYLENLHVDDVDESIFVREQSVCTPLRFTPFGNQANANHRYRNFSPVVDMGYNTQNILNIDGTLNSITIKSRLCDAVEFPKIAKNNVHAKQGESPKKNIDSFLEFSEMYQWLKEIVNDINLLEFNNIMVTEKLKEIFEQVVSPEALKLMSYIQTVLMEKLNTAKQPDSSTMAQESLNKSKADINLRFFLCTLEKLLNDEFNVHGMRFLENLLTLESFVNAVVALCAELDGFIRDNTSMDIVQIMEICNISAFDFWRVLSSLPKAIKGIPSVLRRHLFELELNLMFSLAWQKNSPLIDLLKSQSDGMTTFGGAIGGNQNEKSNQSSARKSDGKGELGDSHVLTVNNTHNMSEGIFFIRLKFQN
jgi:hypothetical protein